MITHKVKKTEPKDGVLPRLLEGNLTGAIYLETALGIFQIAGPVPGKMLTSTADATPLEPGSTVTLTQK